ncbi:metal-sensitive transcriptional regulator [Hydrogenobaculum acidophilum]
MRSCDVYLSQEMSQELIKRLSKIEGQVRGIQKMVEEKRDCNEILIQISAVKSALNSVMLLLLEEHFNSCVKPSIESGDMKGVEEFIKAIKHLVKGGC